MKTDEIDKRIINELLTDSRQSLRRISKKAGVSVVTVLKRIKRLEKEKVILGYTLKPEYESLGYDIPVIVRVRIAKGKLFEVEKKLASHPNVSATYDITGDFDAMILARFKNRRSLDSFIKKVQGYDFVLRTETSLILNTIKEENILVG